MTLSPLSPRLGLNTRGRAIQLVWDTCQSTYSPVQLIQINKKRKYDERFLCFRDHCLLKTNVDGIQRDSVVPRDLWGTWHVWDYGCAPVDIWVGVGSLPCLTETMMLWRGHQRTLEGVQLINRWTLKGPVDLSRHYKPLKRTMMIEDMWETLGVICCAKPFIYILSLNSLHVRNDC